MVSKRKQLADICEEKGLFLAVKGDRFAFFERPGNTYWGPDASIHVATGVDEAMKYVKGVTK